jgi:ActR/RegA family two-component response regulator
MEPSHPASIKDRNGALAGEVIVLLEDDELIRRATERMLRRFGAEVVVAASSAEALAAICERNLTPSCVIADYWLNSREDGLAAVAALRQGARASLRGLIITGDVSDEVTGEVAEAGLRLLRKPVNIDDFVAALLPDA